MYTMTGSSGLAVVRSAGFVLLLFAVPVCTWGCGPDDSGGGDSFEFESDVGDDKPIGEMSNQEHVQLCEDVARYTNDRWKSSLETVCTANAHVTVAYADPGPSSDDEAQNRCVEQKSACESNYNQEDVYDPECSGDFGEPECDVPVSAVEECVTKGYDRIFQAWEEQPSCQNVEASYYEDFEDPLASLEPPTSCERLEEECPDYELPVGGTGSTDTDEEDPCDEGEQLIKYDRDDDGEMETFCAKSCAEDPDCASDKSCTQNYCI